MERYKIGLLLGFIGVLLFPISLFVVLPSSEVLYIPSLFGMFAGIVLVAIGFALSKGVDKSIDLHREDCYYCRGSGKRDHETCPRCGGTGIAPVDE